MLMVLGPGIRLQALGCYLNQYFKANEQARAENDEDHPIIGKG